MSNTTGTILKAPYMAAGCQIRPSGWSPTCRKLGLLAGRAVVHSLKRIEISIRQDLPRKTGRECGKRFMGGRGESKLKKAVGRTNLGGGTSWRGGKKSGRGLRGIDRWFDLFSYAARTMAEGQ